MSREHSYEAFTRWANEKLEEARKRDCIFCGFPTRHASQTCPAHRDLAPSLDVLLSDAVESQADAHR